MACQAVPRLQACACSRYLPARVRARRHNAHARARTHMLSCGKDATFAITDTGRLFTWGNQQFGKLGLGTSHGCMNLDALHRESMFEPALIMEKDGSSIDWLIESKSPPLQKFIRKDRLEACYFLAECLNF